MPGTTTRLALTIASVIALAACGGATPDDAGTGAPAPDDGSTAGSTADGSTEGGDTAGVDVGDGTLVINSFGGDYEAIHEEAVIQPFEQEYGVEVEVVTAYSADALAQLTAQADNPQMDVVHFSGGQEVPALADGLLVEHTEADLPLTTDLAPLAVEGMSANGTGPVIQATPIGLIYNTEELDAAPTSWQDLFADDVAGRVVLTDLTNTYGVLGMLAVNDSLGGEFPDATTGLDKLGTMAADGDAIVVETSPEIQQAFAQRGVVLAPYAQDYAETLRQAGVPVDFVIPDEGGPVSLITANVVANGDNEELAKAFVNFQLRPEVQAQWAEALSYSPTNTTVELSDEVAQRVITPDEFDSLTVYDPLVVDEQRAGWTDTWNDLITS